MDELTELALAARDGDTSAVAAWARSTYRDVWRFCAYLDAPSAADDLTQEVYVRALRALPSFRGDSSALTWLLAISRRTVADTVRRRQRRRRLDPWPDRREEHALEEATGAVEVRQLLVQLPADQRAAVVLTQVVGLTYAEAAEVFGCPVGTVRSRVARARDQLFRNLEPAATD